MTAGFRLEFPDFYGNILFAKCVMNDFFDTAIPKNKNRFCFRFRTNRKMPYLRCAFRQIQR